MNPPCASPLSEEVLTEYWARELEGEREAAVEEHLFHCSDCGMRLKMLAAMGAGVVTLAREGRISGIISRALLNLLQREGVNVRLYTVSPGETIPCAVFPDDDVVVLVMRADLTDVDTVNLSVTGPDDMPFGEALDVPMPPGASDVLWATPGSVVREMPSTQLRLTLRSPERAEVLGEYFLEHQVQR
jgi:hypothetical protein